MEDTRAAWAVIGIVLAVKVVVGVLIVLLLPMRAEAAYLYTMLHLSVLFGAVPLLLLTGGAILFWLRVLRLRARRRQLQWLEWHVEEEGI